MLPVQEPVTVSAVATCKSVGDKLVEGPTDQPAMAEVSVDTQEPLSTSETVSDETVKEMRSGPEHVRAKPAQEPNLFTALKLRTPTAVREVDQVLDQVELTEFGPAEWPIRELATISVLTRHGVSTEQVRTILFFIGYIRIGSQILIYCFILYLGLSM